jgi:threonine/homoserine efflux transporter RhtA
LRPATIQEVGAALAVGLFVAVGAVGAVFVRFAVAGDPSTLIAPSDIVATSRKEQYE